MAKRKLIPTDLNQRAKAITQQTIKLARTASGHAQDWLTCLQAHAGGSVPSYDDSLLFLDDMDAWPALFDRWSPYLG